MRFDLQHLMVAVAVVAGVLALHQKFADRFGFAYPSLLAIALTFWAWAACWQSMASKRSERVVGLSTACFLCSLIGMGLVWADARGWGFSLVSMAVAAATTMMLQETSWSWVPRALLTRLVLWGALIGVVGATYAVGLSWDPEPIGRGRG